MPAYFDTGFSVRQPMWHGEGMVLDDYPTDWNDAREKAGLLWEPKLLPVYGVDERILGCMACGAKLGEGHWTDCTRHDTDERLVEWGDLDAESIKAAVAPIPGKQRVIRDDSYVDLGVVSDQLGLVYHSTMGQILESVLAQPNVKFETSGSCKGGAQVWALAYLDEPYTVPGDDSETYPFVALLNNHDGSGACKLVRTQVRVVCWNTYQAASMDGQRTGMEFTFRHVGDVEGRIEEAVAALQGARFEATEWTAMATELFGMKVDEAKLNHFLADFIPEPPADIISPRVRDNIDTARTVFKHLYLDSPTAAHTGTGLGLVDAAVEYLDHVRGYRSRDTYIGRTLLRPEPLKAKAVALVREHCAN